MSSYPSISAVIPVYNGEKYIRNTIESLLNQTYKLDEIVIVNDHSNDQTGEILLEYSGVSNIRVFDLKENKGVSFARNYGVDKSRGDWILFIDADDVAEPNLVEMYVTKIKEASRKNWVLIHSAYRQIDSQGNFLKGIQRFKQVDSQEILGYQFIRNHVNLSGTIVKRMIFEQMGGFNNALTHSEDWDLWLRLAFIGGYGYVDQPLFRVRRHGTNTSRNVKNMLHGEKKILSQYDINVIKDAIYKRTLTLCENKIDYVNILFRLDKWETGKSILDTITDEDVGLLNKVNFLKGIYYIQSNDSLSAKKSFELALKYNKKDGASLNNFGVTSIWNDDIENGVNSLKKAITLFPEYMDARYNLDIIQNKRNGDFKITLRQLRPVLIRYMTT